MPHAVIIIQKILMGIGVLALVLAIFFAGIAGGILSIGMIRGKHDFRVTKDAGMLYLVSSLILVAAAVLEVWVTPNL